MSINVSLVRETKVSYGELLTVLQLTMDILQAYTLVFGGLWATGCLLFAQSIIASNAQASQKGHIPGKLDPGLSHDSFVFRSYRTLQNSLEHVPLFLLMALLAVLVGVAPGLLSGIVWIFFGGRLLHMALYYAIATEKNPSPRSWFFLLSLLMELGVLLSIGYTLVMPA